LCPPGKHALGGGGEITKDATDGSDATVSGSAPILGGIGWEATTRDLLTKAEDDAYDRGNQFFSVANQLSVTVWAVCASTS